MFERQRKALKMAGGEEDPDDGKGPEEETDG
jgi:hypothetical protein